ncbi:unnamed protein product [Ceratitis capitata]|uniref:(Mediterranean fruit fly) hypothetical protein n=1 Tax=Ceratitis capitata TaxID=7213 RepID=A0A811UAY6_CERCA|nr:unnamed protein product [Ceratitis capitata]
MFTAFSRHCHLPSHALPSPLRPTRSAMPHQQTLLIYAYIHASIHTYLHIYQFNNVDRSLLAQPVKQPDIQPQPNNESAHHRHHHHHQHHQHHHSTQLSQLQLKSAFPFWPLVRCDVARFGSVRFASKRSGLFCSGTTFVSAKFLGFHLDVAWRNFSSS